MSYKRLTVEDVEKLMEEHYVDLIHNDYGFYEGSAHPSAGCAVSMLILRHCGSVTGAGKVISQCLAISGYARAVNMPTEYLYGLECGFDYPCCHEVTNKDFVKGYEDGQAVRHLVRKS